MKKLQFSVDIRAPKETVWKVLWEDTTYNKWTGVFSEGSYAKSDWKEGSEIEFLSPPGDGMYSQIVKKTPNEFMSFKHLGVVKGFKKVTPDKESESWAGATENYSLKESGFITTLSVEIDVTDKYQEYFKTTFPEALAVVKSLSEN